MLSEPKTGEFYSISQTSSGQNSYYVEDFFSNSQRVGTIKFSLDNEICHYERRIYNLYELIGDIGGIYQIILSIFAIALNHYTGINLKFLLVNRFF